MVQWAVAQGRVVVLGNAVVDVVVAEVLVVGEPVVVVEDVVLTHVPASSHVPPAHGAPPVSKVQVAVQQEAIVPLAAAAKELIAVEDGYRESAESWKTVLRDLKRRGMRPPVVAVGDGAMGFWAAVRDVWPKTREQRDWFHKLATSSTSCRSASSLV